MRITLGEKRPHLTTAQQNEVCAVTEVFTEGKGPTGNTNLSSRLSGRAAPQRNLTEKEMKGLRYILPTQSPKPKH